MVDKLQHSAGPLLVGPLGLSFIGEAVSKDVGTELEGAR